MTLTSFDVQVQFPARRRHRRRRRGVDPNPEALEWGERNHQPSHRQWLWWTWWVNHTDTSLLHIIWLGNSWMTSTFTLMLAITTNQWQPEPTNHTLGDLGFWCTGFFLVPVAIGLMHRKRNYYRPLNTSTWIRSNPFLRSGYYLPLLGFLSFIVTHCTNCGNDDKE